MPVIKTIPLNLATGVSVSTMDESSFHGIDVADYVSVGLSFAVTINGAATGSVFLKVYGCNDHHYSTNQKFHLLTYQFTNPDMNGHFALRCLEFRNIVIKVVNATNASLTFNSSIIGVRLT